jgi:cysteine desulfurase/selenocysteine lyase
MGAAAEFLMGLGMDNVRQQSRRLAEALVSQVASVSGLRAFPQNSPGDRVPIVSFAVGSMSPDDAAAILCNRYNIMVRSGVHCAEPLVRHFGQKGLVRVSLCLYNTVEEIEYIAESLSALCSVLA